MVLGPLAIDEVAQAVLGCVCEALDRVPVNVPGLMGCPCRKGVVVGVPVAEGCDTSCTPLLPGQWPGQLTVNVVRLYASDKASFPRERSLSTTATPGGGIIDRNNCFPPQVTAVELAVTVFRCAPGMNGTCPPTMEALSANAMQVHADMLAVQEGLICCLSDTDPTRPKGRRWVMGQTVPIGPQGGCTGFETRLIVALDDAICCPAPEPQDATL